MLESELTYEGGVPTKGAQDYHYSTVMANAEFSKQNEKDGLYDLVFTKNAQEVFENFKNQNDLHNKRLLEDKCKKIDSLEPIISNKVLDKGEISLLTESVTNANSLVRISERKCKQIDVHYDEEMNDFYLVATLSNSSGGTFLYIKKINNNCSFDSQEEIIELTYDNAVGSKCGFKSSKCWKGFKHYIFYFSMTNYREEKLWKYNVRNGKNECLGSWKNQYKTWDIQFQSNLLPNNQQIKDGYINGLTQPMNQNENFNDELKWMEHTAVAKVCSNIDDTKLKVVIHDLKNHYEITAFEYPDVGKMYNEITPPLTATLLNDRQDNFHVNSGKQYAVFNQQGQKVSSAKDNIHQYHMSASSSRKLIIRKDGLVQTQFNCEELSSDNEQQELRDQEVKYLDVQNEKSNFAFRLHTNGKEIKLIQTGLDNIYRSSQKDHSSRHYLTGLDWPLFQAFSNVSNVFHYRDFRFKKSEIATEEFRMWSQQENHWVIGAKFENSDAKMKRKLDWENDTVHSSKSNKEVKSCIKILPWFVDYQMYQHCIPCLLIKETQCHESNRDDIVITLAFMDAQNNLNELINLDIIPAQQFDNLTKGSLLSGENNGIENCIQICQSSNLREDMTQDFQVIFRHGKDENVNLVFQEFQIKYSDNFRKATAQIKTTKKYYQRGGLLRKWKVLPMFESEESQIVIGVNVFEDDMIIKGYDDGEVIHIGKKEFEIDTNAPKKDDADFDFGPKTLWMNKRFPRPFRLSFEYRFDTEGELIPIYAHYQENWGGGGAATNYGVTWYGATNRHDFTFRTEIFGKFPPVKRPYAGFNMKVGQWYKMDSTIDEKECSYSIDGKPYAIAHSLPEGSVPNSGFFGMIHYSGQTHRSIRNMYLTKLNAKFQSNWKLCQSFRNFEEHDYQITTEIGSVGYKAYDNQWSPFVRKQTQGILFESRIQSSFFDDEYTDQVYLLERLSITLSNTVPRYNDLSGEQFLKNIKNKDFLQPQEVLYGKSVASFKDTDALMKLVKNIKDKEEVEEDQEKEEFPLSLAHKFADGNEHLIKKFKMTGMGQRGLYEGSDDFHLQTTFEERLLRNDLQSFKILFKLLQNQENKAAGHKVVMRNIHLMTYNKPEFAIAISEFMKESPEIGQDLTFGLRMKSALLPKYSKMEHVRPLNLKTHTQESYPFNQLQGDEDFLNLTEFERNIYLKVGEQIIKEGKKNAEIESDKQEMAIDHFFINFGNVKLQNKICKLKDQWQQKDELKTQQDFLNINDVRYADFLAANNQLFIQEVEHQLLFKHMMMYQFQQTYKFFMGQFIIYFLCYALPLSVIIFDLGTDTRQESLYWLCFFTQILFQIPEYLSIINDGAFSYISNTWNVFDQLGFFSFVAFFLRRDTTHQNLTQELLLIVIIIMMLLKINFLLRVNPGFGLLVTLVKTAVEEMMAFTSYFAIWLFTFVLLYKVTHQTAKDRSGFEDGSFFNYFLLVFENSIGNINDPTYDTSVLLTSSTEVYILWGVWWFNQFMVVIILLNFLIAVISQSYENVMNSATILKFKDIAQLNKEAYSIMAYFNIKMIYTNRIIFTIRDEDEPNQDDSWTGFIQTLKLYIRTNVSHKVKIVSNKVTKMEAIISKKVSKMEERLSKKFDKQFNKLSKLIAEKAFEADKFGAGKVIEADDEEEEENQVPAKAQIKAEPFPEGSIGVILTREKQTWDTSKHIIDEQGGRMYKVSELQQALRKMGPLLYGQDQWVAVVRDDGSKDWCQIGNQVHEPGKSHVDAWGYPVWGDRGEGCSLHIVYKKAQE